MKKFIALMLSFAMLLTVAVIPVSAAETTAQPAVKTANTLEDAFVGDDALIVFVTGIGQSYSYRFDQSYVDYYEDQGKSIQDFDVYESLIAEGKYQTRWNLFNSFDEAFSDMDTIKAIANVVIDLLASAFLRKTIIQQEDVETIIHNLFKFNLVDEEGNSNPRVVTPRYAMPVSEYLWVPGENGEMRSEARERFFSAIPCEDIAKEKFGTKEDVENGLREHYYEEYLYVFNYSAFSYTSKNIEGLHDFIETILETNTVGATEVVLVPMSMGASVTTAYLDAYPTRAENHVKRVVGIVGAWDGTEIIADMLTQTYCEPLSADLFYNGLISDLVGEPWGYVVNIALRLFPKQVLRDFIDMALRGLATDLFGPTPSLSNMAPLDRYEEVMATEFIRSDVVRAEVDAFYAAKDNFLNGDLVKNLQNEGVTFSFIAGYGLPFGACTADYSLFGFMKQGPITNSDEIINIDSTAPGTTYAPYNEKLEAKEGSILSPDGSIDASTCKFVDTTWYFYQQKHELEYNNTALSLALNLATGHITSVADCDGVADENGVEDTYYYPRFNKARNLKPLKWYKEDLQRYCDETGYVPTADVEAVFAKAEEMAACTENKPAKDDAILDEVKAKLTEIGVYTPDAEPGFMDKALNAGLKGLNDLTYMVFGPQGFLDFYFDNIAGKF